MDNKQPTEVSAAKPRRLPLFAKIFFGISAFCALLYVSFMLSESFSDFFNRHVSSLLRSALAHATSFIPFSLGEFILILSPIALVILVVIGTAKFSDTWRDVFVYCGTLVSIIALIFSIFTLGFAPAYRGSKLDKKLGIEDREVSAEELYDTAVILSEKINIEYNFVSYDPATAFSVMPYGFDDMNDKLISAYHKACDKYPFVQRLDSRLKPVMLSELMSYTHITGVYSFFTGEANINVAFPDYTIPYTAAHELSHQRGIAREDEANFMAFLVCMESDDPYVRYSGYLNLFEYVTIALYQASPTLYFDALATLPPQVRWEMNAYSQFFQKYRYSTAGKVSEAVNDTSLKLHGTEGTKSYGMVVDLAVAYYKSSEVNE